MMTAAALFGMSAVLLAAFLWRSRPKAREQRTLDWILNSELPSTCDAVGHSFEGGTCVWCHEEEHVLFRGWPSGDLWVLRPPHGPKFWVAPSAVIDAAPYGETFHIIKVRPDAHAYRTDGSFTDQSVRDLPAEHLTYPES